MAQPQYQQPPTAPATSPFPPPTPTPPPQPTASPAPAPAPVQQIPIPAAKLQRLSPGAPSQPTSPYSQSPYTLSPGTVTPTGANPSPHFPPISIPQQNVYTTPYGNKPATPVTAQSQPTTPLAGVPLHSPHPQQSQQILPPAPQTPGPQPIPRYQPLNPATPIQQPHLTPMTPQPPGVMGPPQKPADKAAKEHETVDGAFDVLAGSGIDLRWEENFTLNFAFDPKAPVTASAQSFHQYPPGDQASFYGAGPANQPGKLVKDGETQDDLTKEQAEKAWHLAAYRIARARESEVRNPRVLIAPLWKKMEAIATEHGLELLLDKGKMGDFIKPIEYLDKDRGLEQHANVTTKTTVGPDGAIMETSGRFLPEKAPLIDQLALVSLATHQQLKSLVADAARLARGRQAGSHGIVPEDWADAAAPANGANGTIAGAESPRFGWESAVSPMTNPLKRRLSHGNKLPTPVSDGQTTPKGTVTFTNELVSALRSSAKTERNAEEARLQKRQNRSNPDAARSGSVAPGTPGGTSFDSEKAPTKKEQKIQAKAKISEAETHMNANKTTNTFLGGGRFGKKRKTYSWMTNGDGGGSGASTPGRLTTTGLPGTPGGGAPVKQQLTSEGTNRLGSFREDKERGQGLQLRDWIAVLESVGREPKALQSAYAMLEKSGR